MRKSIITGFFLFLFVFMNIAEAGEVTMFGPEQYIRTSGQANVYEGSFPARSGTGRLVIFNGSQSGDKRIDYAISSAYVYLNGKEIFGPQDFNQNIYYLEASVDLFAENAISIELASSPDSYVSVQVIQEIDPPTVFLGASSGTIISGGHAVLSWSSVGADFCTLEPGIGFVEPTGSVEISPSETTEYRIIASNPGGTGSASTTVFVLHRPVAEDNVLKINEDGVAEGKLTASDEDGDGLMFSIVSSCGKGTAVITDPSTGTFEYTPDPDVYGSDFFTFKVNDGELDSNTATLAIEILPVNDAPEITGFPEPSVYENTPYSFLPKAVDADGDPLSFSIANQPVWAGFNSATGLLYGTPAHAHVGITSEIIITVSDGEFNSSLPAFNVTVVDPDVDKDEIDDLDEINTYGTDPNAADSDNDGIDDGDELAYWGENWNVDYDGDGLTNLVDADSDNDGMPDGWELQYSLDPSANDANLDFDGDGIVNFAEYKLNMNADDPDNSVIVETAYEYNEVGSIKKAASVLKKQ